MIEYLSWAKYVALVLFIALLLLVVDFEDAASIFEVSLILFLVVTFYLFLEAYANILGRY